MVSREENEKGIKRIKSWCPKCFMAFENGPSSQIVQIHMIRRNCDTYPCNKPNTDCVRRFRNVNAANRHIYCYSADQTYNWSDSLKLTADTVYEDFGFDNLHLGDSKDPNEYQDSDYSAVDNTKLESKYMHYSMHMDEGPPFQLPDNTNLTEIFTKASDILGQEFPKINLNKLKAAYKKMGYTSAHVFRLAKYNQGSWEFIYRDFAFVTPEAPGLTHVIKYLVSQKSTEVSNN